MMRIGLLTSGGDCQGLNAALRGVGKALYREYDRVEVYGFIEGYRGLMNREFKLMRASDFSGILTLGGTILGTSRQPFKDMRGSDDASVDKIMLMADSYKSMKLDCLVILGGNGTHKSANLLSEQGLNIITLPKTIDNDLFGTDVTFGFQSAVDIATDVIDKIHTTASAHRRTFIIEIMGNKAGWLTLHAGLAGGADIILIPEIPFEPECVIETVTRREEDGSRFSIIAMAEGALSAEEARLPKKELRARRAELGHPTVSYSLAKQIEDATGFEVRVTVPGHVQRGGSPVPYDKVLATMYGVTAVRLIKEGKFGCMVAFRNNEITTIPLGEVAGVSKPVPAGHYMIETAKLMGICFGGKS